MEQYSEYLMSSVKSNNSSILMNPYSNHSWEEEAFAEDGRGPLGGFVWPPRSYSCSFCRREFKSAQALGGHMNVHRREKAKLKQTPTNTIPPPLKHNNNKQGLIFKDSVASSLQPTLLLAQESSISETKSCVYDDDEFVVVVHGNGTNTDTDTDQTKLVLGFDLDFCSNAAGSCCKRQKTSGNKPLSASLDDGLDLELRLAS